MFRGRGTKLRMDLDLCNSSTNVLKRGLNVIYPDKVRINCYYYRNYSFVKDIQMIFATVLGKRIEYGGEVI